MELADALCVLFVNQGGAVVPDALLASASGLVSGRASVLMEHHESATAAVVREARVRDLVAAKSADLLTLEPGLEGPGLITAARALAEAQLLREARTPG